jgi:tetratricopeptide (TPR) repeat protein
VRGVAAGLAAAAILVLAVQIVRPDWLPFGPRSGPGLQELIAMVAKEPHRPVDGRLRGFKYAPPPSAMRGPGDRITSVDVRIIAATLQKEMEGKLDRQAELGVVYLVVGQVDEAIAALKRAVQQRPDDPYAQNDLSAAYIARFAQTGQADDARNALEAAQLALQAMPSLREAAFNRALSLDRLQRNAAAAEAWQQYIALGPRDAWTEEAEGRLQQRPQSRTMNDETTAL